MAIGVVVLKLSPMWCHYPSFLYLRGRCYKEGNLVSYNMIPNKTLSLLAYFTYILIDTIIYALRSMPWSSGIFQMVVRVIVDPSLGHLSPCKAVPKVPILISRVFRPES
jgi:hypothetical protein